MWRDKNGDPTYKVEADGAVDWDTFSGFRRYNADMYRLPRPRWRGIDLCAGACGFAQDNRTTPSFSGSSSDGRKNLTNGNDNVMPAFGDNKNVTCYFNDIYVYLRARSTGVVGRGRPDKHAPKPAAFTAAEDKCMGPD